MRFRRAERRSGSRRGRARKSSQDQRGLASTTPTLVDHSAVLDLVKDAMNAGVTRADHVTRLGAVPGEAGQRLLALSDLAAVVETGSDDGDLEHFLIRDSVLRGLRRPDHPGRLDRLFEVARIEPHHLTPIVMTAAASLALRPGEVAPWQNRANSAHHDVRPLASLDKAGVMIGVAVSAPGPATIDPTADEGWFELSGLQIVSHSYPYDALLIRLPTIDGPTCFLVPIRLADGTANRLAIKDRFDRPGTSEETFLRAGMQRARAFRVGPFGAGDQLFGPVMRRLRADAAVIGAAQMAAATEALASGIDRRRDTDMWYRRFVEEISLSVAKDMTFDAYERLGTTVGDMALAIAQHWVRTRFGRVVPDAAASMQLADIPVSPAVAWTSALLPLWGGDAQSSYIAFSAAAERGGLDPFLDGLNLQSGSPSLDESWKWLRQRAGDGDAPVADRLASAALAWAGSLLSQRGRRDALAVLLADDAWSARSGRREGAVVIDLRSQTPGSSATEPAETNSN
jgi:hypothetical protein